MSNVRDWKYDLLDLKTIAATIDDLLDLEFEDDDNKIEPKLTKVNLTEDQIDKIAWSLRGIIEEYLNPNLKEEA